MKISISQKRHKLLKSGSAAVIPRLQHVPSPQPSLPDATSNPSSVPPNTFDSANASPQAN
ncbi:hypothetical protein PQQ52_07650 [Paraburkholderia sediminicola]|uniref:hypothetical protein n=1 Tax=Paraburkholderia sediminicola TaxID=458836 RepID=UPI0038B7E065